jgi:hypothetical protein
MHQLPFLPLIRRRGYSPVGHPGIEPGDTAVSERPFNQLGRARSEEDASWAVPEVRKMEVSSLTVLHVARVQAPLRRRPRIFQSGERRERSPACERRSAFEAVPAPRRFTLQNRSPAGVNRQGMAGDGRGRSARCPRELPAARFPAGADHLAGSSSEEGAVIETDRERRIA